MCSVKPGMRPVSQISEMKKRQKSLGLTKCSRTLRKGISLSLARRFILDIPRMIPPITSAITFGWRIFPSKTESRLAVPTMTPSRIRQNIERRKKGWRIYQAV